MWDTGIPLALFNEAAVETRADTVTAAPSTVGVNMMPIQQMLFAPSVAPLLGIAMPSTGSGTFANVDGDNGAHSGHEGEGRRRRKAPRPA